MSPDPYAPTKEDRFSFGSWTVGSRGVDLFGGAVRGAQPLPVLVRRLSEIGAWGINVQDDDLVEAGAGAAERSRAVREFRRLVEGAGLVVPMATTNLFSHRAFRDGALTSTEPGVRAFALRKVMRAMDAAAELGASVYVMWNAREGSEIDAAKDPREALKHYREAVNYLCAYVRDQGYGLRIALESKPSEPRGDAYLPTAGHVLAFIATLDAPAMVGVNPEVAHEKAAGLNFHHGLAQVIDAGKLFHVDLNDQRPGRFDQNLRFGTDAFKEMFYVVKLLTESGYEGPLHFDALPNRADDEEGVWRFAEGCMRSYKILREKVRRFAADAEIQGMLAELGSRHGVDRFGLDAYSPEGAARLRAAEFDEESLGARGLGYERLDQLVTELLLGVR